MKVVEVPKTVIEYVKTNTHDSIYITDSVVVPFIYCPDDTIDKPQPKLPVKEHYRTEIKYKGSNRDSVRVDSIPYIVKVPYAVEKQLSWFQKTQMYIGDLLIIGLIGYGLFKYRTDIFKFIIKLL